MAQEDIAVTRFRDYLRINTSQPTPDYDAAREFFEKYASELGLPFQSVMLAGNRSMDIFTWEGTEPSLPSIALYSHIDVVPSFPEHWKYDPFSAHKDENGDIFARGSQDMKCVGIQYLEAIRKLMAAGVRNKRTVHILFGPDEEIGGKLGMGLFVDREECKALNIGFALDEGIANPGDEMRVFYAERNVWWMEITCPGNPGHGSAFLKGTAGEKIHKVISRFFELRSEQEKRLLSDPSLTLGDVTSANLTIIQGGVQFNVVPDVMKACFDVRVPPTVDFEEFENQIKGWCAEAGPDVTVRFQQKTTFKEVTATDSSSPWWLAFSRACEKSGVTLKKEIFPAGADARYLRQRGIPAYGFSPMNRTPILLHDHNEYLNEATFLRGVDIYCNIIPALTSVCV